MIPSPLPMYIAIEGICITSMGIVISVKIGINLLFTGNIYFKKWFFNRNYIVGVEVLKHSLMQGVWLIPRMGGFENVQL
jgi:hypothetical protein